MGDVNSKKGEEQNSSGNLMILPEIGRLGRFSGRHEVGKLKFWEVWDFGGNISQNLGWYSTFSGGLLFTHGSAQTAFVEAVAPRVFYLTAESILHLLWFCITTLSDWFKTSDTLTTCLLWVLNGSLHCRLCPLWLTKVISLVSVFFRGLKLMCLFHSNNVNLIRFWWPIVARWTGSNTEQYLSF